MAFFFYFVLWLMLKMVSRYCLSVSEDASDTYIKDVYLYSVSVLQLGFEKGRAQQDKRALL